MTDHSPVCYIISGFLGAGKTTYSQKLAQETGAVHLNPDAWCMKLFKPEEYENNWSQCFAKTVDYLWEKASEYYKDRQSIIFDMGFWTRQSRDAACEQAKRIGFVPIIHYVYAPDEILKERIAKRQGVIAEHNLKHFDEIRKRFEEPSAPEQYIKINTA